MSEFIVSSFTPTSTSASTALAERPFLKGANQFLLGWLLGLIPLALGLLMATWGAGAIQAFGVVVMASAPAFGLFVPLTLLANGFSRWVWIGALVGCLTSALLDVGMMVQILFAS